MEKKKKMEPVIIFHLSLHNFPIKKRRWKFFDEQKENVINKWWTLLSIISSAFYLRQVMLNEMFSNFHKSSLFHISSFFFFLFHIIFSMFLDINLYFHQYFIQFSCVVYFPYKFCYYLFSHEFCFKGKTRV